MTKIVLNVLFVVFVGFAIAACDIGSVAQRVAPPAQSPAASGPVASTAAPSPNASQNVNPTMLVDQVVRAATPDARIAALLDVMRALDVGVRKPDTGAALVAGSERNANDFYLYDWELKAISVGLERKQMRSLDDIAKFLTGIGAATSKDSQPITAEAFQQTLEQGVQAASKNPQDPYSLVLLLVRELGTRHDQPYDLFNNVPAQQLQFDALQTFLITTDIAWVPLHQTSFLAPGRSIALLQNELGVERVAYIDTPCTGFGSNIGSAVAPWGKYVAGIAVGAKWATGAAVVPLITEMIHGEMLAYSVQVKMVEGNAQQLTHYGPAGHASNAGKELRFHLKVDMLDDYGDTLINCGALAGYTIPKPGGIASVPMIWETHGLEQYGTISYDPPNQKTGADGVAALIFQPKNEMFPGMGIKKDNPGSLTATALYQSAFGNIPGSIAQFMFPKYDVTGWDVESHVPRGFKFEGLKLHADSSIGATIDWVISGHVCGQDPLAQEWDVNQKWVLNFKGVHSGEDAGKWAMALAGSSNVSGGVANSLGGPSTTGANPSPSSGLSIAAEVTPGSVPTVKVLPPANGVVRFAQAAPVPLVEDTSCPAP
jgi:hypothetical protein